MKHLNAYVNRAAYNADTNRDPDNSVSYIRDELEVLYHFPEQIIFADPEVANVLFINQLISNPTYSTKEELAGIRDILGLFSGNENITSFNEFQYFTGVDKLDWAFWMCYELKEIILPPSITSIEEYVFADSGITEITLLSLTPPILYESSFEYSYPEKIYVPASSVAAYKSATNWSAYATKIFPIGVVIFEDPEVANILYTNGLISNPTYSTKEELAGIISIDGLFEFSDITSFDELQYFTGLTSLLEWCFSGCESLASITIPNSVTILWDFCFIDCTSLTSIIIPNSVTSLGEECFSYCSSLTTVILRNITPPTITSDTFDSTVQKFYVPSSSVAAYKAATNWSAYATKIFPI